jgi:hypothetical protein
MGDDFSDGWIDFEEEVDRIKQEHKLSLKDIKEYFKMYLENKKDSV